MNENKVKETIDKVAESVKGAVDMAADGVKTVAENETVKETVENAKKTAKKVAESDTAKTVKKTAKKVAESDTVKSVRKSAKKATDAAKKQYTKLALQETYIQFFGQEIRESEIMAKVEEDYKAHGHRLSSIKTLNLYIKPEDGAAYYVINDQFTGRVDL